MVLTLVKKDVQRLKANWIGMVILLAMPICITGLIGAIFGPSARNGEMPRIKLAVVNEDDNIIGSLIAGAATGEQGSQYLDGIVADREESMRLINDNEISAVIIVPADFTSQFLAGEKPPPIELVKNPAQSYMPAITEELIRVVTEVLNAVSINFQADLPEIVEMFEGTGAPDSAMLSRVVLRIGRRLEKAEAYLFPPVIGLESVEEQSVAESGDEEPPFNVFAFVMPGLAAMFLLFAAEGATRDLLVERRAKTLDRYRTLRVGLADLFIAKSIYSLIVVVLSASIMLIGGGWVFGITWQQPVAMSMLTLSYAVFCTGFTFLLIAVIYREKLAALMNTVIIMMMAFLGGSMMPTQNLPPVIRDVIAPVMPNHVFAEGVKRLQFGREGPDWVLASVGLTVAGAVLLAIAIAVFKSRLLKAAAE